MEHVRACDRQRQRNGETQGHSTCCASVASRNKIGEELCRTELRGLVTSSCSLHYSDDHVSNTSMLNRNIICLFPTSKQHSFGNINQLRERSSHK